MLIYPNIWCHVDIKRKAAKYMEFCGTVTKLDLKLDFPIERIM